MGCDIHLFIEHADFNEGDPASDALVGPYWINFGGEFNLSRNYSMFEILAGVRGRDAKFSPRGLPAGRLGWRTQEVHALVIDYENDGGERHVTPRIAEQWVSQGISTYPASRWNNGPHKGKPMYVTDPDAHTPSWLTADEFEQALNEYAVRNRNRDVGNDYRAVLAALRALETKSIGARVVFWFDN